MSFVTLKETILFVLAIYAACLSTLNLWRAQKKDRRSLKVTLDTVLQTYGPQVGPAFVRLTATNAGHRTAVVTRLSVQLPDGKTLSPMQRNQFPAARDAVLPTSLAEGEATSIYMSYADIGAALLGHGVLRSIKLTPICEDSVGGSYRGDAWYVEPREWAGM